MTRKNIRIYAAAALATGAVVAAGTAVARTSAPREQESIQPVRYAPTASNSLYRAYRADTPDAILASLVARLGASRIVEARVGKPPSWAQEAGAPPDAAWAYFTVAVSSVGPEAKRAIWEADLVGAAAREAIPASGGPELLNSSLSLRLPSGETLPATGGFGHVARGQVFAISDPATARANVRAGAAAQGLAVQRLDVLVPVQAAPAVVVTHADPEAFVANAGRIVHGVFGAPGTYEGLYLEVRDRQGEPFFIQANSYRSGTGRQWIRRDLDPRRRSGTRSEQRSTGHD